jgi:beta-mannosidase
LVKASYFYLRRVFAPILASFRAREDGGVELWSTNDTADALVDRAAVTLATFDGQTVWEETVPIKVASRASRVIATWPAGRFGSPTEQYLAVSSDGDRFPANRHFFAPIKDLRRAPCTPTMTVTPAGAHELQISLRGAPDGYAIVAHLLVPHEATRFSDNYVDLPIGAVRRVTVTNDEIQLDASMVTLQWR